MPLNIGDKVYQANMDQNGFRIIEWEITLINTDGTINISTRHFEGNNHHTVNKNNVRSETVHTNCGELIVMWYDIISSQWRDVQKLAEPYLVQEDEIL